MKIQAMLQSTLDDMRLQLKMMTAKSDEFRETVSRLERQLDALNEEKQKLLSQMKNQRQLYLMNEQAIRDKENEQRTLKSKISSSELHVREKETKLNQLTLEVEHLRAELNEAKTQRDRCEKELASKRKELNRFDEDREKWARDRRFLEDEVDRMKEEKKTITRKIEEMDFENRKLEEQFNAVKREQAKEREALQKVLEGREKNITTRNALEEQRKAEAERRFRELQAKYEQALQMADDAGREIEKLRAELKEQSLKLTASGRKVHL